MGTNSNRREWNDLPEDLLELILSQLRNRDQRFFGQVCRSWRQVILRIKSRPGSSSLFRSSWLIAYENDGNHRCYFHDLLNSKHCIREFPELHGTVCLGSRYGWSLMCSGTSRFFFFNFFTEQRISLPKRKSKERLRFEIFSSFSKKNRPFVSGFSNPNSSDWMVVIIRRIDSYKIEISRYRRGEKGWNTRICGIPTPGQTGKISGALVQKDIIYCFVEYKGNLRTWVFDAVELRLARIDYNLKSNLSKTQKHSVDGKRVLVFTPKFADLCEKFLMRNPSLENWSSSRRSGYDADEYPHRYVSLCPFVLTHPPLELASFSQSNPSSCFWTYRCVSAPDYSSQYGLKEWPKKGSPHLQVFHIEPQLSHVFTWFMVLKVSIQTLPSVSKQWSRNAHLQEYADEWYETELLWIPYYLVKNVWI